MSCIRDHNAQQIQADHVEWGSLGLVGENDFDPSSQKENQSYNSAAKGTAGNLLTGQQPVVNLPISTSRAPLDSKKHFIYVQHIKDPATLQHKELVEANVPKFLEDIQNFACVFEIIVVTDNAVAPVCPAARCSPSYQAYCPIVVE